MKRILIALISLSIIPTAQAMNWSTLAAQAARYVAYTGGVIAFVKSVAEMSGINNNAENIGSLVMNQAGNPIVQQLALPIAAPVVQEVVQSPIVQQTTQVIPNKSFFSLENAPQLIAYATTLGVVGKELYKNPLVHAYAYGAYQAVVNSWLMLKVNTLLGNTKDMLQKLTFLNRTTIEVKDKVEDLEDQVKQVQNELKSAKEELTQQGENNTEALKQRIAQLEELLVQYKEKMDQIEKQNTEILSEVRQLRSEQKTFFSKFSDSFWSYFKN